MLFLVDDQQAEFVEPHLLGQQGMGAHHDIDGAAGQPVAGGGGILRRDKARQRAHLQREAAEPLGKGLRVLARQQRGGRDHRDLLARHRRGEGGAHGHLGLAESHVAADQPVHRLARGQVGHHVLDGAKLVVGFLVGEAGGEFLPRVVRRLQHRGAAQRALGGDADQAVGHLADAVLEPRLARLPGAAAELVEQALLVAEAAEQFDVLDRQVKPRALGVFQHQAFVGGAGGGDHLEPVIAPDPVIDVHDQIAGAERLRLGQEILGPLAPGGGANEPVAQHVLFADHGQGRRLEPVFERPHRQVHPVPADAAGIGDVDRADQPLVGQQPVEAVARTLRIAGDDDRAGRLPGADVIGQRAEQVDVFLLALGREIAPDAPAGIAHPRPRGRRQRVELHRPAPVQRRLPRRLVEVKLIGRYRLVDAAHAPLFGHRRATGFILVGDTLPARKVGRAQLVIQRHRHPGQVVEQLLQPLVEERQPVLGALRLAAGADRLVKRVVGAGGAELDAVVLPETADRRLVEHHLADRGQFDTVQLLRGALACRVEAARPVEHVAEQVQPHRPALARRVDVDDAAADRVVARLQHRGRLDKPHPREEIAQRALVDAPAHLRGEGRVAQDRARRHPLHRRAQRGQQHEPRRPRVHQPRQRRHPRRGDVGIGADPVIGQAIPCREGEHRHVGREEPQRRARRGHALVVARDMDDGAIGARDLFQDQAGVETFGGAGHRQALRFGHLGGLIPAV